MHRIRNSNPVGVRIFVSRGAYGRGNKMSKILQQMTDCYYSNDQRQNKSKLRWWVAHVEELERASKHCALGKGSMGVRIGEFRQILIKLGVIDDVRT